MVVKIEEWPCFYNHYYENQHHYIMFNEIFLYQMSKIPYETVRAAKTRQRHGTGTDSAFRNPCLEQSCFSVKYVQKPYQKLAKTRTMQGIFAEIWKLVHAVLQNPCQIAVLVSVYELKDSENQCMKAVSFSIYGDTGLRNTSFKMHTVFKMVFTKHTTKNQKSVIIYFI